MSQIVNNPTPVTFPGDLAAALEREAKAMGLDVPTYVAFLRDCNLKGLDARFRDAAKYVFSKYPETLRKLAQ